MNQMRPLKISLQNFGPYVDETVDFTRFFEAPLFLITGPTGSGKTTIFDGMCYALFNETSGKKRSGAQLRSDFASPQDETSVEFVFEHQNKTYTIKRWPKQFLAGKNGKVHEKKAKVELTYRELDGEKKAITKIPEAKRFIDELLHLTAEQFTKVILLPQGQFRNFLAADSGEKETVLRNLFGSELFEQWTDLLKAKFKQANEKYQAKEQELKNLMEQADFASETEAPAVWQTELKQWLTTKNEQLAEWQAELITKKQLSEDLQQQLLTEQELATKITQLATINEQLMTLETKQTEQEQIKAQIVSLKWAQKQQPLVDELRKTQRELATLAQKLPEKSEQQRLEQQRAKQLATDLAKQRENAANIEQQRYEMQNLSAKLGLYQEVKELFVQLNEAKQKEQQSLEKYTTANTKIAEINEQLAQIKLALNDGADLEQEKYRVATKLVEITKLDQKSSDLQQRATKLKTDNEELVKATKAAETATTKARALENELAQIYLNKFIQQLSAGKPCPVCGSLEHPHPGEIHSETQISEADVKKARATMNKLVQTKAALASSYAERQTEYEKQFTELSKKVRELTAKDDLTAKSELAELVTVLRKFAHELDQKHANLVQKLAFLAEQKAKQSELEKELVQQTELVETFKTQQQEYRLQKQTLTTKCAEKQQQLPREYADQNAAEKQVELWQKDILAYEQQTQQLETALKTAEQAQLTLATEVKSLTDRQQTLLETSTALQTELNENCTLANKTLTKLEELLAKVDELETLEEKVAKYQQELATVKGQTMTLTAQIAQRPMPKLEQTSEKLAQAKEKVTQLQEKISALTLQVTLKQGVYEKVHKILLAQADKLAELSQLKELVDAISGKGEQKLGFERYILQTYLQEVLVTANERLTQLTNGRYELCLNEEIGRGASSTGLELDIYDEHAGKRRSVHTLSGGESFLAALALALALGEVIQKKSGGIQIEALFVDEGFGSLDQNALQSALEILQSIEGQNRMVGIISHVTELQTQLLYQLQVVATGERSTLRYRTER